MAQSSNFATFHQSVIDDQYEIICPVGRGRHSVVYKALKIDPERIKSERAVVALKILVGHVRDPELHRRRMKREALAMLSCVHRNVIKLLDYNSKGDLCYLAMEFAEGGDLRQMLEAHQLVLTPDLALRLMLQVLTALERIHQVGIIHRDIKPENILLTNDGEVKLADFGISLLPGEKEPPEEVHRGVGTFDYLAPECLEEGAASRATDVYSSAVTCYQLLTGNMPFGGSSFTEQITNKMESRILPLKNFIKDEPPLLQEFMEKALSSEPDVRFESATEFKEAIESFLAGTWEKGVGKKKRPLTRDASSAIAINNNAAVEAKSESRSGPISREDAILQVFQRPRAKKINVSPEVNLPGPASQEFTIEKVPARKADKRLVKAPPQRIAPAEAEFSAPSPLLFTWRIPLAAAAIIIIGIGIWLGLKHVGLLPGASLSEDIGSVVVSSQETSPPAVEEKPPAQAVKVVEPEEPTGFFLLTRREGTGIIRNLLADGSSVSFATIPAMEGGEVMVFLAIGGWEPVIIDAQALRSGEEVRLNGGGMRLALRLSEPLSSNSAAYNLKGTELSGTYKEYFSGREGKWAIW